MDKEKLAQRLRDLRAGKFTQHTLADVSGVSYGSIQAIERGDGNPEIDTLINLSSTLKSPLIKVAEDASLIDLSMARHGEALKDVPADFREWGSRPGGIQAVCLYFVTGDDRALGLLPLEYRSVLKALRAALASDDVEDLP